MSIAVPLYGFGASGGSPNKSTIIVTAPTGSTVTCKMGSTTKTATEKNGVWKFGGLDLGTWTITSTKGGDSATQDVSITRLTVEYVTIVYRITPEFTYTGDYEIVDDSDSPISNFATWKSGWKIRFLTSGTFTVTNFYGWNGNLDVFLVGGGGGTKWSVGGKIHSGGAGGGYTQTGKAITVTTNTPYTIDIGAGGIGAADGGTTSAFGLSASGGGSPASSASSAGAAGGSGGGGYVHASASGTSASGAGNGGSDGSDGVTAGSGGGDGGKGQGTTTREFGEENGKLYAGGGAGASNKGGVSPVGGAGGGGDMGSDGATNTGGGAGNALNGTHNGGSGIAVIRNTRGGGIMAKSMTRIENGLVINVLWCSDSEPETENLINPADRPVAIGDTYSNGKFYRDGVEILTPLEEALKKNAEYEAALREIETALGVNNA